MPQPRDDEQLSPSAVASATNLATTELDPEEKAVFDHETRLNDAIDTNLRSNIDRDPRAVWLLYVFKLLFSVFVSLVSVIVLRRWFNIDREENVRYEHYEFYYRLMVDCLPLAGATMSDSYLNKWWALFWGSLVIILGTIPMALFAGWDAIVYVNNSLLFMPLATVTLGVGLIAPTIDAFSGDQFLEIQERGRDRSFSVLFFLSRIGVLIADSIFAGLPLYGINVNYQLPWRHVFYPVLLVACGAPALTLILCIGRSRFRIMSSSGEFILYRILKIPIVAAFRYVAASKTERAAAGHWLNFAARDDAEGSLFVQELHDFGLVLALLLLPSFIFSIMDRHTTVLAQHLSQFLADNESEFSEQTQWRSTVLNFVTPALVFFLTFVVYPLARRLGWNVSPYRRLGAGYLCMMMALGVSNIMIAFATHASSTEGLSNYKFGLPFAMGFLPRQWATCPTCFSYRVTFFQHFLLAMAYALYLPTSALVLFVESGRHLRALAIALWLLLPILASPSNIALQQWLWAVVDIPVLHGVYGGIGTAGFLLYVVTARYYTPRKGRIPINRMGRLVKEAEFAQSVDILHTST